jgi:branched-chain amino acid transport system substrate-binding protein
MKKIIAVSMKTMFLSCLLFVILAVSVVAPVSAAEPIKIGMILSLSGWGAVMGTNQRDATVAYIEDVNKKGGILGRPIELYIEDDKSNPTNAVLSATKLIKDKNVCVIVGPSTTDSGMAMIPIAEQAQVPFAVSGPVVAPFKKWVFHVTTNDLIGASHILEIAANDFGAKRIAILHDTANFGMTGAKVYNKEISQYSGASIVIQEKYEVTDTNMVPQLTKIKAANPDIIIFQGTSGPAAVVAKNCKQLGIKIPVACVHPVAVPDFFKNAGAIAEESQWIFLCARLAVAELLTPEDPYRKGIYEPFKQIFQAKYGPRPIIVFHAVAYDAINIVVQAIKAAGSDDRAAVRNALETVNVEGALGTYQSTPSDHRGFLKDNALPVMLQKGQFALYHK